MHCGLDVESGRRQAVTSCKAESFSELGTAPGSAFEKTFTGRRSSVGRMPLHNVTLHSCLSSSSSSSSELSSRAAVNVRKKISPRLQMS